MSCYWRQAHDHGIVTETFYWIQAHDHGIAMLDFEVFGFFYLYLLEGHATSLLCTM